MTGTTISHYKILEKLGEGGMGVVYKAEDTKLDRAVALKFLPPHLISSEQDRARFVQEAKSASSLNHPNVATIYEIDTVDGQMFIAMEFVDGLTLRDKLASVTLKQAIDIGIQLADGLAAAHEKGIVHRDIKPENIMIRKDGICQIMDFGLAKLRGKKSQVNRLTKEGSTIGTAGYMSPEQVQGLEVDHRSDIFSLGVVLYELFTGELPFKGVHETALLYEIVNVDAVPMSAVKPEIDPSLDAIVLECLVKETGERYQSVAEVAKELRRFKRESTRQRVSRVTTVRPAIGKPTGVVYPAQSAAAPGPLPRAKSGLLWMIAAAILLASTSVFAFLYFRTPAAEPLAVAFHVHPPEGGAFESPVPALSPDGKYIAFVAIDSAGRSGLWLRPLNAITPKRLEGTEGADFPFWSPDSRFVGFFAAGKLKRVDIAGGPMQSICDVSDARGGSWNADGIIIFAADFSVGLSQVSAAGGIPAKLTELDTVLHDISHRFPVFLPDGKHFLYFKRGQGEERTGIVWASLDHKESKFLFPSQTNVDFFPPSSMLVLRDRVLMRQPFDPSTGGMTGEPVPVAENVSSLSNYGQAGMSVAETGTLAYVEGDPSARQFIVFDRTGKEVKRIGAVGQLFDFRLSPDTLRIVCRRVDAQTTNNDLWLIDIARGTESRFTFDPSVDDDPVWSPDGTRIVYDSSPAGTADIYIKASTGAGNPVLLVKSDISKAPEDWSSDGKYILYSTDDPSTRSDLWAVPLDGDRKPFPYLHSKFVESDGRFSPDGQWVAYASDESGKTEVYIQKFPVAGGKWQISTGGGGAPAWRKDGRELYYLGPDKRVMAVDIHTTADGVQAGIPAPLFRTSVDNYLAPNRYDILPSGAGFVVNNQTTGLSLKPITVLVNRLAQQAKR